MRKVAILLLLSILIITRTEMNLPICNIQTAKQAIPPRIFAEQTIDGSDQPIAFTRFIHNKYGILGSEFSRCYFNALDPNFIYHTLSIGLLPYLFFIYTALEKKLLLPSIVFLIFPSLPIFNIPTIIVSYAYKIFAIIGLAILLFKKK